MAGDLVIEAPFHTERHDGFDRGGLAVFSDDRKRITVNGIDLVSLIDEWDEEHRAPTSGGLEPEYRPIIVSITYPDYSGLTA